MDKETVYMVAIIGLLTLLGVVTYLFLNKSSCRASKQIERFKDVESEKPKFKAWNEDICPCTGTKI